MQIAGYLKTSFIEWPGKIAAVIFTQGCNFRCPFCHNRDLVFWKNGKMDELDEEEIFNDLGKRKEWVDGVVITGGEPTLQSDLGGFLGKVKDAGFATMLETNGSLPEILKKLIRQKRVDFVAMDYKTTLKDYLNVIKTEKNTPDVSALPRVHRGTGEDFTSKVANMVKESMRLVLASGLDYEFRTTVVPTIHDKKTLIKMAHELKKLFKDWDVKLDNCHWTLQAFRPKNCLDPEFDKIEPFNQDQMREFLVAVKKTIPAKLR